MVFRGKPSCPTTLCVHKDVFFKCRQGICHESQADAKIFTELVDDESVLLNEVENPHSIVKYGALGIYAELVNSYLHRNLSWESDIVDALAFRTY